MRRLLLVLTLVPALAWAQPFRAEQPRQAPAPAQSKGAFAPGDGNYSADRQRCQNFQRELRSARRAQREADLTAAQDAAAMRRAEVEAQARRAGCL